MEFHHEIVVVGAGLGGIGTGIELKRNGFDDFVILEQSGGLGGTWRKHTYPGLTVDIPALTYSFSYEPKPDWSSLWAPQAEVLTYCEHCAEKHGLGPHFRFDTQVREARFDPSRGMWITRIDDDTEYVSRYLINASGYLSVPRLPAIDGLGNFGGKLIHTSDWSDDVDLAGKRIAFIGTGATGIQLAPQLAPIAERLSIFQRTPIWLLPKPAMRLPQMLKRTFAALPATQRLARVLTSAFQDLVFFRVFTNYPQVAAFGRAMERLGRWHIRRQVTDPKRREQLTPDYNWGCKRMSFSNDFYPMFNRDNVDLVTAPIVRATRDGLRTADGAEHPADVIVCATGYQPFERGALPTYTVQGTDGVSLDDYWEAHRYQSFRGFAVNGFPNFFLMFGPYSVSSTSYIALVEIGARNIVTCLKAARDRRADYVEVRSESQDTDMKEMWRLKATSVWNAGNCVTSNSYYVDRFGDSPGYRPRYHHQEWWASRKMNMEHFELRSCQNAASDAAAVVPE
jgi:cation diffusion facilitator CzcD-associated flavoprotein CzcO